MSEVVYQNMSHNKFQCLDVCSTDLQWGNMIDLNIKYQNYQQVCVVLKKEEEHKDLLP